MNNALNVYVKRGGRWQLICRTQRFATPGDAERFFAAHGTVKAWIAPSTSR